MDGQALTPIQDSQTHERPSDLGRRRFGRLTWLASVLTEGSLMSRSRCSTPTCHHHRKTAQRTRQIDITPLAPPLPILQSL